MEITKLKFSKNYNNVLETTISVLTGFLYGKYKYKM